MIPVKIHPDGGPVSLSLPGGTTVLVRIRISPRASRMRLSVGHDASAVLVIPPRGVSSAEATDFLAANRHWLKRAIDGTLARISGQEQLETGQGNSSFFPDVLPLPGRNTILRVRYHWRNSPWTAARFDFSENTLVFTGNVLHFPSVARAFELLLIRAAELEFKPRILELAQKMNFSVPTRLQFKLLRSRWGSCSLRTGIVVNALLLAYPPELLDYVIIHELCHLREMNHSPRFWAQVETFFPDWKRARARLKSKLALHPFFRHFPISSGNS